MTDDVNEPSHYNKNGIEVIDVIETYAKTDFRLANVLKYVCRCEYKSSKLQDLQKAQWYLNRVVEELEDAWTVEEFIEERKDEETVPHSAVVDEDYNPIEKLTTYEEAMTSPGLCPFIDIEGYVHGVQCGCMQPFTLREDACLDPTVTNWPGATTPPETFVGLGPDRVAGDDVAARAIKDEYYTFDRFIIKGYCTRCDAEIAATQPSIIDGNKLLYCSYRCVTLQARGE